MALATMMGHWTNRMPYTNQRKTPMVKKLYIAKDIPDKLRVRQERHACGKNAKVVRTAAIVPIVFVRSIDSLYWAKGLLWPA